MSKLNSNSEDIREGADELLEEVISLGKDLSLNKTMFIDKVEEHLAMTRWLFHYSLAERELEKWCLNKNKTIDI